jgi:hypothetical protein
MTQSKFEDVRRKKEGVVDPTTQMLVGRWTKVALQLEFAEANKNELSRTLMQGYKWLVVVGRWVDGPLELSKKQSNSI